MAIIRSVRGFTPQIGDNCFLAENAAIIGDVVMGNDCSVWYSVTLRGDVNPIRIGNGVNIQDGAVLHTLYQKSVVELGNYISIGHNVTLHGCRIDDYALIGMGAVVLDFAHVGEGAIVAAGSVVLAKTVIPPHELWGGIPAKFIKKVSPEQSREMNKGIAEHYVEYASWYVPCRH
jgi:carbonic anhydrase/acetyltransferase-like protein (isoleucine patch superfamily)